MRGHYGQAYGIRLDHGVVFSGLVDIESIMMALQITQFDEFFLFYQIWIANLIKQTSTKSKEPKSVQPTEPKPQNTPEEHLSTFFQARIRQTELVADLGNSIGNVYFGIKDIFLRGGFPGKAQSPPEDSIFVVGSTSTIDLKCLGNLEGRALIEGIALTWRHNGSKNLQYMSNKFALQILPIVAKLVYNVSPILILESGNIIAKLQHSKDNISSHVLLIIFFFFY